MLCKVDEMTDKTFEKHKLVIDEWFVNGWNGTKAYMKYYPKSAYEGADSSFRLLVEISRNKEYISEKKRNAAEVLKTSHEALLNELQNWAYSDITETLLLDPSQVKDLPIEIRRLITKYKTTTKNYTVDDESISETVIELWFVDKVKAMEMIHKHVGFYAEDNFQKVIAMSPDERQKRINELKSKI